jgi:general secretion pathway protein N
MSRRGGQLLTTVLAGVCAVFLVLALAFQFGVGAGYGWQTADADEQSGLSANGIDTTAFKLPPETEFDVIHERPLFNEDRKPAPDQPAEVVADVAPPPALNINLTGTVRAPGLNIVMIQDKSKNQSVALKEGMPLPGDLNAWSLEKVKSRSAVFKSTAGEEIEVELTVAAGSPKSGKPGAPAPSGPAFGPGPSTAGGPAAAKGPAPTSNQSEDLQKRIEERRRQMREAADRNRKDNAQPPPGNSQ